MTTDETLTSVVKPGELVGYNELVGIDSGENNEELVPLNDKVYCAYTWFDMLPYTGEIIYVRKIVADKILLAEKALQEINPEYHFKVFYGYRHPEVQEKYFINMKNELRHRHPDLNDSELDAIVHNYIAVPDVAGHPTGGAIDITITTSEEAIPMGSGIEDFSEPEKMQTFSKSVSETAQQNRKLLHDLLTEQGFAPFYGEWWHFSYGDKEWAYYYGKKESLYSPILLKTLDN